MADAIDFLYNRPIGRTKAGEEIFADMQFLQALLAVRDRTGGPAQNFIADALAAAAAAEITADGKITSVWQDNPPTTTNYSEGDLWFDTNDGNKCYQLRAGAWVNAQDSAIGTAISAAAGAQATADTKIVTYYQTSAPATGLVVGDLWHDTDDAQRRTYRWSGSAWVHITDQTAFNTAAAITSQGDLATTNAAVLPFGTNGLTNTEFALSTTYPPHGYVASGTGDLTGVTQTASIVTAGPRRAVKSIMTGTVSAGTYFDLFYGHYADVPNARRFQLPVVAGDRIGASVLVAKNAAVSQIYVNVQWLDASGVYVGETAGSAVTATANGDTGNPADYALSTLVATAPTNARFVNLSVRCLPVASAVNATGWGMSPMLCRIPAGQTVVPPYTPGPVDRAADQTLTNTAAAITGQGPGATAVAAEVLNANGPSAYLNKDAEFRNPWTSGAFPADTVSFSWSNWSNGSLNTKVTGKVGPYAVEFVATSAQGNTGWNAYAAIGDVAGQHGPGWYVMELDIWLVSGSLLNAGMYGYFSDITPAALTSFSIDCRLDKDIDGIVQNGASPTTGRMYRYRKLIRATNASTRNILLYMMANWDGFGSHVTKTVQFHRVGIRPASDAEKATQSVLNVNGGISGAFTAAPISSTTSTTIVMAAVTWSNPHESVSLPSATISGLSPSTRYYVFRDVIAGTYDATSTYSTAITRLNDQNRQWLMCGYVTLPSSGGGPGGGGGGGFIP